MTADEARKTINRLLQTLDEIPPGKDATGWDDNEALLVWHALTELATASSLLVRSHAVHLALRLPSEYEHPVIGFVHWDTESKQQWDGAGVLNALTETLVDKETGEIVEAVPTDILRKVLPAVQPGQTSSRWNRTGLTAAGIQPSSYCDTEWGSRILRRGPKYRRSVGAMPETGSPPATPSGDS